VPGWGWPSGVQRSQGAEVHQGLGVKRADVGVARVFPPDRAHGVGERPVQRSPVGGLGIGVSLREGVDQRALDGTRPGGALAGLCQGFRPPAGVWLVDGRVIDVRAARVGDPPPGHRTGRVERRRLPERADRLVVVERVEEVETLVEIALGLGRGGRHRTAPRPESVEQGLARPGIRGRGHGGRFRLVRPRAANQGGRTQERKAEGSTHGGSSGVSGVRGRHHGPPLPSGPTLRTVPRRPSGRRPSDSRPSRSVADIAEKLQGNIDKAWTDERRFPRPGK
jgi:hypothetical protein